MLCVSPLGFQKCMQYFQILWDFIDHYPTMMLHRCCCWWEGHWLGASPFLSACSPTASQEPRAPAAARSWCTSAYFKIPNYWLQEVNFGILCNLRENLVTINMLHLHSCSPFSFWELSKPIVSTAYCFVFLWDFWYADMFHLKDIYILFVISIFTLSIIFIWLYQRVYICGDVNFSYYYKARELDLR